MSIDTQALREGLHRLTRELTEIIRTAPSEDAAIDQIAAKLATHLDAAITWDRYPALIRVALEREDGRVLREVMRQGLYLLAHPRA
jgi:hypothetical protein